MDDIHERIKRAKRSWNRFINNYWNLVSFNMVNSIKGFGAEVHEKRIQTEKANIAIREIVQHKKNVNTKTNL